MADKKALLTSLYDAISRQDVEGVVALMHPEVNWPNTLDEGRILGLQNARDYWIRQFSLIRLTAAMLNYEERPDGSVVTQISFVRHSLDGALWDEQITGNLFRFQDGLIVFGDWVEPPA